MPPQISMSTTPPSGAAQKSEKLVEVKKKICCFFDNPAFSSFQMCSFAVFICLISFFDSISFGFGQEILFINNHLKHVHQGI